MQFILLMILLTEKLKAALIRWGNEMNEKFDYDGE